MPVNLEKLKNRISSTSASNKNDLYNSNIYWSQKPYNICDILIESLSNRGDIVYDPFLGSGVTLLECIKKDYQRIVVGCEINEAPVFIIKTLLKNFDLKKYEEVSKHFISQIKQFNHYYTTHCTECNAEGVITSVIFDKPDREADIKIKTINYRCICSAKCNKVPDNEDIKKISIKQSLHNITDEKLIPDTKLAVYENQTISQIFTGRNFAVLDEIVGIINGLEEYNDIFRYILMSVLHLCKITDKHSNSQWPLWIPKVDCVEKNIIDILEKKVKSFTKTIKYINKNYDNSKQFKILQKGSQFVTEEDIKDDSVQLIITDPPYLGQVAYSEYMQLYKPFLGFEFNIEDEIVVSSAPSRNKDQKNYFELLDNVFEICSRKLKNNAYFCMYFHDSNLDVWHKLISMLANHNINYITQVHIPKSNTLKNIISPKKSLNGDCILFFQKSNAAQYGQCGAESIEEIEENIIRQSKILVRQNTAMSTPQLYDNGVMEVLIQNGWLSKLSKKYKSLVEIFEKHLRWDSNLSKWTL